MTDLIIPGDEELFAKMQQNEPLTDEQQKRYDQLENQARQRFIEEIGEEKLNHFAERFVTTELSVDYVKGFKDAIQYAISGLLGLPVYAIPNNDVGEIHVVPGGEVNNLRTDLTALMIVHEQELEKK